MTPAEKQKLQALKTNFPYFAKSCLNIRTKKGDEKKFVLNKAQQYIHEKLEKQINDLRNEYHTLEKLTVEDIWISECDKLVDYL